MRDSLRPPHRFALLCLQVSNTQIKKELQKLYITAARQVEVPKGGQPAYVIFVPFKLFRAFKAIQKTLVEELEKRFRCAAVL